MIKFKGAGSAKGMSSVKTRVRFSKMEQSIARLYLSLGRIQISQEISFPLGYYRYKKKMIFFINKKKDDLIYNYKIKNFSNLASLFSPFTVVAAALQHACKSDDKQL